MKAWSIRLLLVLLGVIVVVGAVEVTGRIYIWSKYGVPGKSYGLWQYDEELGAIHRKNAYNTHTQTNAFGFRGTEDVITPKPFGSQRVIVYGGSMVFCYNLADGETWPERLQELMRARPGHERDQVLNGGHISWSTGHLYRRALRDIPALQPDIVVIYSGVNEGSNAYALVQDGYDLGRLQRSEQFGLVATNLDQARWLKRNSILIRLFDYTIKRFVRDAVTAFLGPSVVDEPQQVEAGEETLWIWNNYRHQLLALIKLVREYDGIPVFVVEAGVDSDDGRKKRVLRYSARAAGLMRELGVAVSDPRPAFASQSNVKDLFYVTGVHVSAEGAEFLAKEVLKTIQSLPSQATPQ